MDINTNTTIMKKIINIIIISIVFLTIGCSNESDSPFEEEEGTFNSEESFLPMHIGNYWKNDENNYIEIIDTLRIQGDLYYKFHQLIGGDMRGISYLRIDSNQNLIERFIDNSNNISDNIFTHAKFDAEIGSTFWTLNDQSVNDFKATVIIKDSTLRTFEFQVIYHPNLNDKHTKTYIKGLGYDVFDEVKINGEIFNP